MTCLTFESQERLTWILEIWSGCTAQLTPENKEYAAAYFDGKEEPFDVEIQSVCPVYDSLWDVTETGIEFRVWNRQPHDWEEDSLSEPRTAPLSAIKEIRYY